jgi:hypothetical protein
LKFCKRGHEKTYIKPDGYLDCIVCRQAASKRYYLKFGTQDYSGVSSHYRFGGNRQYVLERDGYKCQECGMTDAEHREKWNRQITIDHIDGQGRYSETQNNDVSNLVTLCLSCHGRKDVQRRWS